MLIIHDRRLPKSAVENLQRYGKCVPFMTRGITLESIAGHPDIFFCPVDENIVIAPDIPVKYPDLLLKEGRKVVSGELSVGNKKQEAAHYNVVVTETKVIHHQKYTDSTILSLAGDRSFVHVSQAYTRCSLLPLKENHFMTSDKGIEKTLKQNGLTVLYVNPEEIMLPGHRHGFIGGCMGISKNRIFISGHLNFHRDGEKMRDLFHFLEYEIIELYDGPLYDGGTIFFV